MKKIICDRCGKEMKNSARPNMTQRLCASKTISGMNYNYKLTSLVDAIHVRTYDLCDDCQHELDNWLNNFISLHNFNREEEK